MNNNKKYALLILVVFSTAFEYLVGSDGRNYLLIGLMIFFFPILLLVKFPFFKRNEYPLYFLSGYMLLFGVMHPETFRIETVIYTMMFIVAFICYFRFVSHGFLDLQSYKKLIVWLISSYCVVLIVQQLCLVSGFPVFNLISSRILDFQLNSLSPEASQSSRILAVLMYSFITVKEIQQGHKYDILESWREDKWIWIVFLYPMLTMQSGTAFILLMLFGLKLLRWRNFAIVCLFTLSLGWIAYSQGYVPLQRAIHFVQAVTSFDEHNLVKADHSAALRILPTFIYVEKINIIDPDYWFGFGVDYNNVFFYGLIPGIEKDAGIGGITSSFLIDFGLLSGLMLLAAVFTLCIRRHYWFDMIVLLFFMMSLSINSQIFWLFLMLLATNKYFYQRTRLSNYLMEAG